MTQEELRQEGGALLSSFVVQTVVGVSRDDTTSPVNSVQPPPAALVSPSPKKPVSKNVNVDTLLELVSSQVKRVEKFTDDLSVGQDGQLQTAVIETSPPNEVYHPSMEAPPSTQLSTGESPVFKCSNYWLDGELPSLLKNIQTSYSKANQKNTEAIIHTESEVNALLEACKTHGKPCDAVDETAFSEVRSVHAIQNFVDHRPTSPQCGNWELKIRWVASAEMADTWASIVNIEKNFSEASHLLEKYLTLHKLNRIIENEKPSKQHYVNWTEEETECLRRECLRKPLDWTAISTLVSSVGLVHRTENSCRCKYHSLVGKWKTDWSEREIQVLLNETAKYKPPNSPDWTAISKAVSSVELIYRSEQACCSKYSKTARPRKLKNESWTEKEMQVLQSETAKYKPPNPPDWKAISKSVSSVDLIYRSEKACRIKHHFLNIRDTKPRKLISESWSEKEVHILQNETAKYKSPSPSDWKAISEAVSSVNLVYRSENACRSKYAKLNSIIQSESVARKHAMKDPYSNEHARKRKKCDSTDTNTVSKGTRLQCNLKNQSSSSSSVTARSTSEHEGKSGLFSFFSFIPRFTGLIFSPPKKGN